MTKRDDFIDCLKGYACFLVLFGHVIMGIRKAGIEIWPGMQFLEDYIWTFHVALFLFLSGYVYQITGKWKSKGTIVKFIWNKFLNLMIPYVVFSVVYIFINSFVSSANENYSIREAWKISYEPVAQYWYLYALFFLFLVYSILSVWMNEWIITILLYIVHYILVFMGIKLGAQGFVLTYSFIFGAGILFPIIKEEFCTVPKKVLIVLIHIVLVTTFILTGITGKPFINDIEELFGVISSIAFMSLICKKQWIKKAILVISKYSFPIYLLHTIFTAGIRVVLIKIGIHNYGIHVLCGVVIGLVIPIIIAKITDKMPFLDFWFYPTKNIKRIKNRG